MRPGHPSDKQGSLTGVGDSRLGCSSGPAGMPWSVFVSLDSAVRADKGEADLAGGGAGMLLAGWRPESPCASAQEGYGAACATENPRLPQRPPLSGIRPR